MLNNKVQDAINAQINAEFWSAYLYLSMSMHFASEGYDGIANWFAIQFKEEQDHATIFMNYVNSRDGKVLLAPIAAVDTEWASPPGSLRGYTRPREESNRPDQRPLRCCSRGEGLRHPEHAQMVYR